PGTLVIARAHPRPPGQMSVAWERAHVHAHFSDDHFSRALIDPGDRVQPHQHFRERSKPLLHLRTHQADRLVQVIHVRQELAEQKGMVRSEAPGQRLPQGRQLLTQLDRKSTRLNSSHVAISYAVFCLKKKKIKHYYKTP